MTAAARPAIAGARRVVVKVGSSSLTTLPGGLDAARLSALVDVLGAVRADERLAAKKARRTPYELSDETWTDDDLPADLPDEP